MLKDEQDAQQPATQPEPQAGEPKPNPDIEPPEYDLVTEGYKPPARTETTGSGESPTSA
jgi:hypothetical protein